LGEFGESWEEGWSKNQDIEFDGELWEESYFLSDISYSYSSLFGFYLIRLVLKLA
jgi:hypothetical protein